jgi:antibiotic biosynthesis monooxygenase (ABM) superfamily enzyme
MKRVTGLCGPAIREASITLIGLRKINLPTLVGDFLYLRVFVLIPLVSQQIRRWIHRRGRRIGRY